jgi:hypothetical protein
MRGPHIVQIIGAPEFQRPNVLGNPTLAGPVDLPLTQYTRAACLLPHLKSTVRSKFPPQCRRRILNLNK